MDAKHAAQVDHHLEQSRRQLAAYLITWRIRNGLSQRDVEALSRAASGRRRITCASLNAQRLAVERSGPWHPQSGYFVALDEMQQLILAWTERGEWPPKLDKRLQDKVTPFLRLDGQPMQLLDWFAALVGQPGVIASSTHDPAYLEKLERLAAVLGESIEQALADAGLRPIRDMDVFLSAFPNHAERDFLRRVVLGDVLYTPEALHMSLPGIALALTEATGQRWTLERLLAMVNGAPNGSPS